MPRVCRTSSRAERQAVASSLGLISFAYSCVPRGSMPSTYSAPTMARRNAFALRLMVEKNTHPPGLTSRAHACTTDAGSGTCSSISMQVTVSNDAGDSSASASTLTSRYWISGVPASRAWSWATFSDLVARSMPVTVAPLRAMASARMPPPQPTSSTRRPCSGARPSIQPSRSGLISCRGRNSLSRSHQRWASSENLASSAGSTLAVEELIGKLCPQLPRA